MNRKRKLIIYLDTCIYGRAFDRSSLPEVRAEATAIKTILYKCKSGGHLIIGSKIVSSEIERIPEAAGRKIIEDYYHKFITEEVVSTEQAEQRSLVFTAAGLGKMDAVHLAMAESVGADFLLTVDKFFIKRCNDLNLTIVGVMNPTNFIKGGYLK